MSVDGVCTPAGSGSGGTCGSGTTDTNGVCVPNCTDGTTYDPAQGCVFDPTQCHDGTVYIVGKGCVDPTAGLTIDVEEGPEPNGGIDGQAIVFDHATGDPLEANAQTVAGQITIKAAGSTEVVHGHIDPFQDEDGDGILDGDVDVYTVQVDGPTLVSVAVDGVGGDEGGLVAVELPSSASDPLATYLREMVNVDGDTATREMMFPAAGTYAIAIIDPRTLLFGGPFGGSGAEYYMSITQQALPTTGTAIAVNGSGQGGGSDAIAATEVKVYQVPMGLGFNQFAVESTEQSDFFFGLDFTVLNNGAFQAEAQTDATGLLQQTVTAGYNTGDTTLVIVDPIINLVPSPGAPYNFEVQTSVNAKPFCAADCSTASQAAPETEVVNAPPLGQDDFGDTVLSLALFPTMNTWFFDVAAANESDAFALTFSKPVDGILFDVHGNPVDIFTAYTGNTMTGYSGQIRTPVAGRYYFLAYAPAGAPGDALTATTQEQALTPVALAFGAQTDAQTVNFANSNLFAYTANATTNPWETFAAASTKTGTVTAHFYDPTTAFGRLDPLFENTTANGGGSNVSLSADALEIFEAALPQSNVAIGHILLDDPTTSYLITTNAAVSANAPTFQLDIEARSFVDLGTLNSGDPQKVTHETGQANDHPTLFLLRTKVGGLVQTSVVPTGTIQPNVELDSLDNDESESLELGPNVTADPVSGELPAHVGGWIAFQATPSGIVTGTASYDVQNLVTAESGYTSTSVNATFQELTQTTGTGANRITTCSGGSTTIAFTGDNGLASNDEGLSDLIAMPIGFQFFGADVGSFRVSTNGFLTFDGDVDSAFGACLGSDGVFDQCDTQIPTAAGPTAIVAPFWTNLIAVTACTKITGQTQTVEWVGVSLQEGGAVKVEAQLNAQTEQITFLYDGSTEDTGGDASIGVEDFDGGTGVSLGFDTAGEITIPGAIRFSVQ